MTKLQITRSVVIALPLATLLTARAAAGVIVVDAGGGGKLFDIQPAVTAASSGDTILVKTGGYSGFSIGDKSLNVVADAQAIVNVSGSVQVTGLGQSRDVVLVGLRVTGTAGIDALSIANALGSVRLERCTLTATSTTGCGSGAGAKVSGSPDVGFTLCTLQGAASHLPDDGAAGAGLLAVGSNVALYDSTARGIPGDYNCAAAGDCFGSFGGDGTFLWESFLFAGHSHFIGGQGGAAGPSCGAIGCTNMCAGGLGGSGLELVNNSIADLLGDTFAPGAAGTSGPQGTLGPGMTILGSGATLLPGLSRVMVAPNPVRELVSVRIRVNGQPLDSVYLYTSHATSFRWVPNYNGMQFTHQPGLPTFLGVCDASGVLVAATTFPDLGPGVDASNYYLQAALQNTQGQLTFTSPMSLVVLDPSF